MKTILTCICLSVAVNAVAQQPNSRHQIRKIDEGLYFMYYDTTKTKNIVTKSTIVEFKNYIALLEMPISNDGAGATHLKDHTAEGEQVLQTLKSYFPSKPLKYVLSTHWHPHSISSVIPFISRKITLVTTRQNFGKIREYIDSATLVRHGKYIRFVDADSMVIHDKSNKIITYRIDAGDNPHLPTKDFLYFYLPRYKALHISCMYYRYDNRFVAGKELIYGRNEDLNRFIVSKHFRPEYLIRTRADQEEPNSMIPYSRLKQIMETGVTLSALRDSFLNMSTAHLNTQTDSIVKAAVVHTVPPGAISAAVDEALKRNDLKKALALQRSRPC